MKKQINPTIKAHLIRGAFYLLLLLAVCAIPFALAQRNRLSLTKAHQTKAPTNAQLAAASGKGSQSAPAGALPGACLRKATLLGKTRCPMMFAGLRRRTLQTVYSDITQE